MKTKHLKYFGSLVILVILFICFTLVFVACKDDETLTNETTYATAGAEMTQDKSYSANIALTDAGLTFVDFDKQKYSVEVIDTNTIDSVRAISNYEITKVSDAEFTLTFSDTDYVTDNNFWRLSSTESVISDGSFLECSIYLESVSYGLASDKAEINRYEDSFTLTMSLTSGKLVDALTKEMILVEGGLSGKEYTLTRVNDTTFTMAYVDAFKDDISYSSETGITLLASAIIGNQSRSVSIYYPIIAPTATIDTSAMQFISIQDGTNVIVPVVVEDGLLKTVNTSDVTITEADGFSVQDVDFVGDNVMLVTLTTTLDKENAINTLESGIFNIAAGAVNMNGKALSIAFGSLKNAISISVAADLSSGSFDGYVMSIRAINGTFKNYESINSSKISIKDKSDNDYSFTIKSKAEKLLVVKIATSSTICSGSVTVDSSVIENRFGLVAVDLNGVFQATFVAEDKAITEIAIGLVTKLATEAVSAAGSTIGNKVGAALTPYILRFLGLPTEITLQDINDSVNELGSQLNTLSDQLSASTSAIMNEIAVNRYGTIFSDYNTYYDKVSYYVLEMYGNQSGLAKLLKMENDAAAGARIASDEALEQLALNADYQAARDAFIAQFETAAGGTFATVVNTFGNNMIAKTFGQEDGYLYGLWGLLKCRYLWDVQTLEIKDTFLKTAGTAYLLGMSATMRYLGYTNSANRNSFAKNFEKVANTIEHYESDLTISKTYVRLGNTIEYTTTKIVQLTLKVYCTKDFTNISKTKIGEPSGRVDAPTSAFSQEELTKIVASANAKGIDFVRSLKEAGFVNAPTGSSFDVSTGPTVSTKTTMKTIAQQRGKSFATRQVINGMVSTYSAKYCTVTSRAVSAESTRVTSIETMSKDPEYRTVRYQNTTNKYYAFQY
ncbi:MAG: hypothetical protein K5923_05975 [Clostridia bacterium]|nr:hypothetical protein [Clostridia bacterium]